MTAQGAVCHRQVTPSTRLRQMEEVHNNNSLAPDVPKDPQDLAGPSAQENVAVAMALAEPACFPSDTRQFHTMLLWMPVSRRLTTTASSCHSHLGTIASLRASSCGERCISVSNSSCTTLFYDLIFGNDVEARLVLRHCNHRSCGSRDGA